MSVVGCFRAKAEGYFTDRLGNLSFEYTNDVSGGLYQGSTFIMCLSPGFLVSSYEAELPFVAETTWWAFFASKAMFFLMLAELPCCGNLNYTSYYRCGRQGG